MREDFEGAAEFSAATGYVQFVAIREGCRRKGIATKLLKESMELSGYESFHLEVTDVNLAAMSCYMKLGFREYKRIPQKYAKGRLSYFVSYRFSFFIIIHLIKSDFSNSL